MSTAAAYVSSGRYKRVLLIGADKMSSIIDYSDRTTCIIFGDGAGAVLFEPNEEGLGFQDEYFRSITLVAASAIFETANLKTVFPS